MARSTSGESVLERVVRILEALTPDSPSLSVSELARRADLPLPTASRLVGELVEHGLLARDPDKRVRIGVRLWELGLRASPTLSLRETAMPVMERLQRQVGHHTQLGILNGEEVLFVERLSADGAVINVTRIGARLPLHASSSGLVLLAFGSTVLQERILSRPLERFTATTVTDPRELRALLATVRRDGFVLGPGFIDARAAGIAVPVRGDGRQVVAALSVVVPNDEHALGRVPPVAAAARDIEQRLHQQSGWRP